MAGEGLNLAHPVALRISRNRSFRTDPPARVAYFLVKQNEDRTGYLSVSVSTTSTVMKVLIAWHRAFTAWLRDSSDRLLTLLFSDLASGIVRPNSSRANHRSEHTGAEAGTNSRRM